MGKSNPPTHRATDADAAPPDADDDRSRAFLRSRHRLVLIGVAAVLLASLAFRVVEGDRVALRGLEAYPLPHTCASRLLLGVGCPGCGLTRSFIHLAHGRWRESVAVHRLGWLLAAMAVLQVPYRAAGLLRQDPLPLGRRVPTVIGYSLLILLLANWVYEIA